MRIVSGQFRGKAIVAPPGEATRPTSDRARQAVFNILEHAAWAPDLQGARVIDVFAGSGALGWKPCRAARPSACLSKPTMQRAVRSARTSTPCTCSA